MISFTLLELGIIIFLIIIIHELVIIAYSHRKITDDSNYLLALNQPHGLGKAQTTEEEIEVIDDNVLLSQKYKITLDTLPRELVMEIINNLNQFDVLNLALVNSKLYWPCVEKLFKKILVYNKQDMNHIITNPELDTIFYKNFTVTNNYNMIKGLHEWKHPHSMFVKNITIQNFKLSPEIESTMGETFPFVQIQHYMESIESLSIKVDELGLVLNSYKDIPLHSLKKLSITFHSETEPNSVVINRLRGVFPQLISLKLIHLNAQVLDNFVSLQVQFGNVKSLSLQFKPLEDINVDLITSLFSLESITQLELTLEPSHSKPLQMSIINHLVESLPNLRTFVLIHHRSDFGIFDIFRHISSAQLSKVSIHCKVANHSGLSYIHLTSEIMRLFPFSLEIIKISSSIHTKLKYDLDSIDKFFASQDDSIKTAPEDIEVIQNTIDLINQRSNLFSRLKYITYDDHQFVIKRKMGFAQALPIN
ncbi:uncharacterized protein RJT21DRAFT_26617 [Scheffersomyces amazonensis]|uniref:uncharacterized protein n=1 Tax=Scheffersomyces amazonensis TaxID=1078765 RepID=UPI00315DD8FE